MTYALEQLPDRFRSKVYDSGSCWIWTGAISSTGYGNYWDGKTYRKTHRVAYEELVGSVPEGLELDHLCRTPVCVNPAHLDPVTHRENCQRGAKGRLVTHCVNGHAYTPENTGWAKRSTGNRRRCRICSREAVRRCRQTQAVSDG